MYGDQTCFTSDYQIGLGLERQKIKKRQKFENDSQDGEHNKPECRFTIALSFQRHYTDTEFKFKFFVFRLL